MEHLLENEILNNPYVFYLKNINRLKNNNSSFPEFESIINDIIHNLSSPEIQNKILNNVLNKVYQLLITKIKFLNINVIDTGKIPYFSNDAVKYPYKETIMVIFSYLEFLQYIYDADAEKIYHYDRYYYLLNLLINNENLILIPTTKTLKMEDFIYTRHIPVYFIGISHKNIFYDGRVQTPLEFFMHDINHSRRLYYYLENNNLLNDKLLYDTQLRMYKLHHIINKNIYIKYILFELFHEYSIPIDKEFIQNELLRTPGSDSPYEYITSLNYYDNKYEYSKTNSNILSGMSNRKLITQKSHNIVYYYQPYATVYSTLYYKFKYGFYDNTNDIYLTFNENKYIEAYEIILKLFDIKIPKEHMLKCIYNLKRVELFTTKFENRIQSEL